MDQVDPQSLLERILELPPERVAEVADFVDFLRLREDDLRLLRATMSLAEPALAALWDNDDDDAYDRL